MTRASADRTSRRRKSYYPGDRGLHLRKGLCGRSNISTNCFRTTALRGYLRVAFLLLLATVHWPAPCHQAIARAPPGTRASPAVAQRIHEDSEGRLRDKFVSARH